MRCACTSTALRFRPTSDMFAALNQPVPRSAVRRPRRPWTKRRRERRRRSHGPASASATTTAPAAGGSAPAAATGAPNAPLIPGSTAGERPDAVAAALERLPARRQHRPSGAHGRTFQGHVGGRADPIHRTDERGAARTRPLSRKLMPAKTARRHCQPRRRRTLTPTRRSSSCPSTARHSRDRRSCLFAPVPTVETRGRAWLFVDHQLKPRQHPASPTAPIRNWWEAICSRRWRS